MPEVSQPFERVSADLVEMVNSARGHRYVLVIIDHFTRYLQLVPLENKEAGTVADAFINNFFTLFGPPRTLLTDNGSEFSNNLFKQVCQILEVKTLYTTCYHPQANGMAERTPWPLLCVSIRKTGTGCSQHVGTQERESDASVSPHGTRWIFPR